MLNNRLEVSTTAAATAAAAAAAAAPEGKKCSTCTIPVSDE